MRIAQWTAADSVYRATARYRVGVTADVATTRSPRVKPQVWSWQNRFPDKAKVLFPFGKPTPPQKSCDLACGGERSDCYWGGGSQDECDEAYSHCLMGCFFAAPGWP